MSVLEPGGSSRAPLPAGLATALVAAFVAVFVLRLAFLRPWVMDWDESTFLLIGRLMLEGQTLYIDVWDNKPPLLYVLTAAASAVSFGSLEVVRLIATALVALIAWQTKALADRVYGPSPWNWVAALLTALAFTGVRSGGILGGEVLATPFFLAGVIVLLDGRGLTLSRALLIGMLFAAATLVRPNFGIAAAVIVVGAGLMALWRRDGAQIGRLTLMGLSGALTLLAAALPFILTGLWTALYASVIAAVALQTGATGAALPGLSLLEAVVESPPVLLLTAMGIGAAFRLRALEAAHRSAMTGLLGVLAALLIGHAFGKIYEHHLLMLAPFLAVLALHAGRGLWEQRGWRRVLASVWLGLLAVAAMVHSVDRMLTPTPARAVYAAMKPHWRDGDTAYFGIDHIVAWRFGAPPPHPLVTHPSSINRVFGYRWREPDLRGPGDVMRKIVARQPTWIIIADRTPYVEADGPTGAPLQAALAADYERFAVIEAAKRPRLIYRRRD